ncbi:hypothetical protein FRB96_007567 [Tulasnella sp. 330]|nr:hypothetical protein FRB96_007567 [Tulasnella sp. 330]
MASIRGPKWAALPLTTFPGFGIAIVWSTEMAFGMEMDNVSSPYLLSLGLSKSMMTLVFISAPLSGFIVQPIVGNIADRSTNKYGRRRPFMFYGCLVCIISFLLLGFTRRFADIFVAGPSRGNDLLTQLLAVFAMYSVNFAVNVVMTANKTIIIDILTGDQQASANAWAARMGGIGAICGFFVAQIDLVRIFPYFGQTQLQILSVLGGIVLLVTHGVTMVCVQEIPLETTDLSSNLHDGSGIMQALRSISSIPRTFVTLPKPIRQLCWIQFFSWVGWFPAAFFATTWIGELYRKDHPAPATTISRRDDDMDGEATRYGSLALFWSCIVCLTVLMALPRLVAPRRNGYGQEPQGGIFTWIRDSMTRRPDMLTVFAAAHFWFGLLFLVTWFFSSALIVLCIYVALGPCLAARDWVSGALLGEMIKDGNLTGQYEEYRALPEQPGLAVSSVMHPSLPDEADEDETLAETAGFLPFTAVPGSKEEEFNGAVEQSAGTIVVCLRARQENRIKTSATPLYAYDILLTMFVVGHHN